MTDRHVIDALHRGVIATTPTGEIVLWSQAAVDLFGWAEAEVVGHSISDVFTTTSETDPALGILAMVASGHSWQGDLTLTRRDGELVRVFVIAHPVLDDDGVVVGVVSSSEDVAEQRQLERRARELADHLGLALDAGGLGTWSWNIHTGETVWDAKLEQLYGLEPGGFDGTFEAYVSLLHPDEVSAVLATVDEAVAAKGSYVVDHRVIWPDGSVHWLQGRGQVVLDDAGEVIGTIGCTGDVTEQMLLALEREEFTKAAMQAAENERLSRERLEFLGRINDALASATNRAEVMHNVTRAAVPRLGDLCSIFVLPEADSVIPEIEFAHADPRAAAFAQALLERFPYDPKANVGVPKVIRTGRTEFLPVIDEELIQKSPGSEKARNLFRKLTIGSSVAVPLVKDGRVLGAMQFINSESSRRYTADDLVLAHVVAARIASSLENIRLNEHQRKIASTLQASLLPDSLPEIPGLDLAVRYWATGEGTEVGGDFYDVFEIDGGWAVVIGDVCGTGPEAASLTGLARHTIRASAWQGADHNEVLRHLNNAVLRSGRTTFCTVLFGTLVRSAGGFTFTVSAGGHPLPVITRASGQTELLGEVGTLLGAFADSRSVTVSTELRSGDTVVLYTDGVTDVPPPHDLTADALAEIVARSSSAEHASGVADRLGSELSAILPLAHRNDDIALLVLKIGTE